MTDINFGMLAFAVSQIWKRADRWLMANALANMLEHKFSDFDRERFIAECRPTEGVDELRRLGKPGEEHLGIQLP